MAKSKTNKKLLKSFIEDKCNKIVLLKDLSNIAEEQNSSEPGNNDLRYTIQTIAVKYGMVLKLM